MTVFVVQDPTEHGVNLAPALRFGRLVYLLERAQQMAPSAMEDYLAAKLVQFDPARDYLLPIGNPAAVAMTGGLLGHLCVDYKLLRWLGKPEHKYVVVNVRPRATLLMNENEPT